MSNVKRNENKDNKKGKTKMTSDGSKLILGASSSSDYSGLASKIYIEENCQKDDKT